MGQGAPLGAFTRGFLDFMVIFGAPGMSVWRVWKGSGCDCNGRLLSGATE